MNNKIVGKRAHYMLDNAILKLRGNVENERNIILTNQLFMAKENFQRLSENLPRGCFYTSIYEVQEYLQVNKSKANRIIKWLEENEIITLIEKGKNKNILSIYRYNAVNNGETVNEIVDETVKETLKPFKNGDKKNMSETANETANETVNENYKKENIKRRYKNSNNVKFKNGYDSIKTFTMEDI